MELTAQATGLVGAAAVRLAMVDLASSIRDVSTLEARRSLLRQVYVDAEEPVCETSGAVLLPPVMARVSRLARSSARAWRCAFSAGSPTVRRLTSSTYRPAQWPTC